VATQSLDVPPGLTPEEQATFTQGWQALLADDLRTAARDLESVGRRHRDNAVLDTALGYLELRLGNRRTAENRFVVALKEKPKLAGAQVGWFLTALADGNEAAAFERLRLLARDHPNDPLVAEYLPTLQLKLAEVNLQKARALRDEGKLTEAAAYYRQALEIAPEVSGLHKEVVEVELAAGEPKAAAEHAADAIRLEPHDVELYRLRGDALKSIGDLELAVEAYRQAQLRSPEDPEIAALYSETRRALERESLPSQYFKIGESPKLSREQLAALLYLKLRPAFATASRRSNVIATDIRDSWAREFIREVVAAGVLDVYPNHTFQPRAFVRRSELSVALAAAVRSLAPNQAPDAVSANVISDVSRDNLNYQPISLTVILGLLSVDAAGRFEPQRFVTGREAVGAVDALARRILP
jgi:tetratricopeptide (TPR) repeat protein